MAKEKTISITLEVGMQQIADTLFSADLGCRYWGDTSELGYTTSVMGLLAGVKTLKIKDYEDGEQSHTLTLAKVKKGLKIMAQKEPSAFGDLVGGNSDQETADVLVQCALFGEVVYG